MYVLNDNIQNGGKNNRKSEPCLLWKFSHFLLQCFIVQVSVGYPLNAIYRFMQHRMQAVHKFQ